jgi:hypothetical protein
MLDARWLQLKEILVGEGWQWRDEALVSPHETMWFTTHADRPDHALFRSAMTEAAAAAASDAASPDATVDQHALHEDLVSLVAALDAILDN